MAEGIKLTGDLPAQEVETALGKVDLTLSRNSKKQEDEDKTEKAGSQAGEQGGQTARYININNPVFNISLEKIDELKKLAKLFEEIQDNINSDGGEEPEPA